MLQKLFKTMMLLSITTWLFGCAVLTKPPEKPEVSLAGIDLVDVGIFEQKFKVQLRVQNPNGYDLPLEGVNVAIKLNDQPFIQAMSNQKTSIPKYGFAIIELDAVSTLGNLGKQLSGLFNTEVLGVKYSLEGKVHVIKPVITLPVEKKGEISLKGIIPGL